MGGANAASISTQNSVTSFTTVQGTPSEAQNIIVSGKLLVSDVNIGFANNENFEFKLSSDTSDNWVKSLTLNVSDSVLPETEIRIRYNPVEPSFKFTHTDNFTIESTNTEKISISLTGTSTRPVYVKPPLALEGTDITMSSFQANWDNVYDASGYYLTLYNTSAGNSEFTEGFDKGLTPSDDWTINADAVTSSSTYSGKSIPAIQLKNTGNGVITCEYTAPPSTLTVFLKSLLGTNGFVIIEAWNGTNWNFIDSVAVSSSLEGNISYNLNVEDDYTRFKFTYSKGEGYVVIDDITVSYPYKLDVNYKDKWVTETYDLQNNLFSGRTYYYKVKASDRTLYNDQSVKYENITDFSNIIEVNTKEDLDSNLLVVTVDNDGTLRLVVPETGVNIYVYNIIGQKILTITPETNLLEIKGLPRKQLYLIVSGNRKAKIAL